ncbi:unnamed protein product [Pleuronectes platessa]|uniref:Uncharacterized protein n=1 Tax=Pleuronectes platessa TaxID=8262 RepID=A0A9N7VMV0_PLEPL|nr:unnamed protein product [Pleuronectes platessa]
MQMGKTGERTTDLQVGGRPLYPSATAAGACKQDAAEGRRAAQRLQPMPGISMHTVYDPPVHITPSQWVQVGWGWGSTLYNKIQSVYRRIILYVVVSPRLVNRLKNER